MANSLAVHLLCSACTTCSLLRLRLYSARGAVVCVVGVGVVGVGVGVCLCMHACVWWWGGGGGGGVCVFRGGGTYTDISQVTAVNGAGGMTTFWSDPVTVDYTPPLCTPPKLLPLSASLDDSILISCAAGGRCDRGWPGKHS